MRFFISLRVAFNQGFLIFYKRGWRSNNNTQTGNRYKTFSVTFTRVICDESDHDLISTEMLEDICDGSQTHPNVNRREARYKIRYRIRQRQSEWKGVLKATQSIGKGLHKVFSTVVKEISQELTPLISTEMLEDICDGSQTHPNVNRREARYKIRYRIRQRQSDGTEC